MSAKIIGQNHTVTPYLYNGRKRFIVEDVTVTNNRRVVNNVIREVGRKWEDVYNYIDSRRWTCGLEVDAPEMPPALAREIERMTY
jgi:hypothetical protein